MEIAFLGLGRMGANMAHHLVEAGHSLRVYDVAPEAVHRFAAAHAVTSCASVAEAATGAEVVFASLPGAEEVDAVVTQPGGLLETMASGSVFVDVSTNAPSKVRELAAILAGKGIAMLDAPVSGGVDGAEAGTLSIMVGGKKDVFDRVEPLVLTIGSRAFYCGAIGAGSVTKLCNNYCSFANAVAAGEALTLGVKAGVDVEVLQSVIAVSTGASNKLINRFPKFLFQRNFEPGFLSSLAAKDMFLALDLAAEVDVPMEVGAIVGRKMHEVLDRGWGGLNSDAIVLLQEELAGVVLQSGTQA
jgi:3-hydroxyisobutyrate dehydrogenase-like beta-hydroxyacid dehydrogenase